MHFKHILVAYDGSKQAIKALEDAIQLQKGDSNIQLTILHVLYIQPFIVGESLISVPVALEARWYDYADQVVNELKQKVEHLPNAQVVMEEGHPAKTILQYAEQNACDLIVIGSRGLGSIKEFMLGSVSHNVVQHSQVPVLVVKC